MIELKAVGIQPILHFTTPLLLYVMMYAESSKATGTLLLRGCRGVCQYVNTSLKIWLGCFKNTLHICAAAVLSHFLIQTILSESLTKKKDCAHFPDLQQSSEDQMQDKLETDRKNGRNDGNIRKTFREK